MRLCSCGEPKKSCTAPWRIFPSRSGRQVRERWSKAAPELRDWVTENRDVLEMFREGSERPDGVLHRTFDRFEHRHNLNLEVFKWLALLEASRLEEHGDMAGAWGWYLAVFRTRVHVMRRGSVFQRLIAGWSCTGLQERLASWAADSHTSASLLRRALEDLRTCEPRAEWDAFSLKVDYLYMMSELDDKWGRVQYGEQKDRQLTIAGEDLPREFAQNIYALRRYYASEPERSRRVLRLAFANWFAFVQDEQRIDRRPAVHASFYSSKSNTSTFFYPVSADAPVGAKKMTPEQLAGWLVGTLDARLLIRRWSWPSVRTSERRDYRALVVTLAGELFGRDRGTPPPSEEALVRPLSRPSSERRVGRARRRPGANDQRCQGRRGRNVRLI